MAVPSVPLLFLTEEEFLARTAYPVFAELPLGQVTRLLEKAHRTVGQSGPYQYSPGQAVTSNFRADYDAFLTDMADVCQEIAEMTQFAQRVAPAVAAGLTQERIGAYEYSRASGGGKAGSPLPIQTIGEGSQATLLHWALDSGMGVVSTFVFADEVWTTEVPGLSVFAAPGVPVATIPPRLPSVVAVPPSAIRQRGVISFNWPDQVEADRWILKFRRKNPDGTGVDVSGLLPKMQIRNEAGVLLATVGGPWLPWADEPAATGWYLGNVTDPTTRGLVSVCLAAGHGVPAGRQRYDVEFTNAFGQTKTYMRGIIPVLAQVTQ